MLYLTSFIISLLASTIIFFPTETLLFPTGYLLKADPLLLVSVISIGNIGGATINYFLGILGYKKFLSKKHSFSPQRLQKFRRIFAIGAGSLLFFSFLPIIGDPMTIAAGLLNIPARIFFPAVISGRIARYFIYFLIFKEIVPPPP